MKNTTSYGRAFILFARACLSLVVDTAIADDAAWYVGAGYGRLASGYRAADFDDGSISDTRVDDTDTAWKLFGGYRFNRYLAVEGGYADLQNNPDKKTTFAGVSDGTGSHFVSLPDGPVSVDIDDVTGFFAAAVGTYSLTDRFGLTGKVGVVCWEAKQITLDLGRRETILDGMDALIGVGAEYQFDSCIAIRGEAERYFDMGDTDQDVVTLSVLYRFQPVGLKPKILWRRT